MKKKVSILLIFLMILTLFSGCAKPESASSSEVEESPASSDSSYEDLLFDTSYVHSINVDIAEEDWSDLLENPLDKTKYSVNVTVDGEEIDDVSFATKGNTSLSSVASDEDSDRYSFKINFGKYVEDQTYHGLDRLNLSNIYADSTYMKDYMSYEIFRQIGVESALTSYVWLTVNGEDYGLYLAVEDMNDSYLNRTTDGEGELYKPETEQLDNAGAADDNKQGDKPNGEFNPSEEAPEMPNGESNPPDGAPEDMETGNGMTPPDDNKGNGMDGNMDKGFGQAGSDNGASLIYTDDNVDSYSDIFDNAETDATDEDMQRVIAALKGLSEGTNLDSYLDTDTIIRYFVAHNFVMNYDSYTGTMLHNYFLYENDGVLSILPWDYNLAYGTFMGANDSTSVVNYGIDTPLSGTTEAERPIWSFITANDEYLQLYHTYFDELLTNYFESGDFDAEIDRVYQMILPYVEKDPTAFYTSTEFSQGYNTLKEFCELRAESIRKQLNGTLSTDTSAQESSAQVDASAINIQDMGTQNEGNRGKD